MGSGMGRSLLLFIRFFAVNIVAVAIIAYSWTQGWVIMIINQDMTYITWVISGLFAFGWLLCGYKTIRCTHQLNAVLEPVKYGPPRAQWYIDLTRHIEGGSRTALAHCLRSRLYSKIKIIKLIANNLITLGLIGSLIGFIITFGGLETGQVVETQGIGQTPSLLQGIATSLYTLLIGAIGYIWLRICYQILATETVNLANAIIEYSEVPHIHENKDII